MKFALPIAFALCTALCWGLYGPTVANARSTAKPPAWSPFKPYVFIGVAYLVIACGGGVLGMNLRGDSMSFTGPDSAAGIWGFLAGSLGALGALFLTSAMLSFPSGMKPKPELVMPIVFGGAVSVSAIVSLIQNRSAGNFGVFGGMLLVVVGIVLVASNTPHGGPGHSKPMAGQPSEHAATGHAATGQPVPGEAVPEGQTEASH